MNRILSRLALTALFFTITACATTPPKQAALQGESILAAVRDMTRAYEKRDLDAFMDKVSPAYPERAAFEKSVTTVFSTYQTIRFRVQYTKMLIMVQDRGNIKATFTWEGEWETAGGKVVKDGARVTLAFDPGTFKLLAVEGKDPFIPQPGETPGKQ